MNEFLTKIKKLNWVLSESTTGNLSYGELAREMSLITEANFYILDNIGNVLGLGYDQAQDTSVVSDDSGFEKIPEEHNRNFLEINETRANLIGEDVLLILGNDYNLSAKYHTVVPSISGGQRQGTILLTRYEKLFSDEEIALCEMCATVVGLEIQRNDQLKRAKERSLRMSCEMALETLSYSEMDALSKILSSFNEDETIIIASKIAVQYKLTNSVIVNALKKLESAGILETKSLGMKGTYIKITNAYLREAVLNVKI